MSKGSVSLELSEYFNDDDSNGYRLAEFLQKRKGVVGCQKYLFAESEPLRLSVDVQLERIADPLKNNEEHEKLNEDESENQVKTVETSKVEDTLNQPPSKPESALNALQPSGTTSSLMKAGKFLSPAKPLSPKHAALRRSGGVSPSDRLRRFSLKRLSNANGRRTLLREFENTMTGSEFSPQVFSTPLSQETKSTSTEAEPTPTSTNAENIAPNAVQGNNANSIPVTDGTYSICASPNIGTENNTADLRRMVESVVETTLKKVQSKNKDEKESETVMQHKTLDTGSASNTTLRRTYTLEKGEKPGQVILTPETTLSPKSISMDLSGSVHKNGEHSAQPLSCTHKTPEKRHSCTNVSHRASGSHCHPISGREVGLTHLSQIERNCTAEGEVNGDDMDISSLTDHSQTGASHLIRSRRNTSTTRRARSPQRTRFCSQLTISFDSPHVAHSPNNTTSRRSLRADKCSVLLKRVKTIKNLQTSTANANISTPKLHKSNHQRDVSVVQNDKNGTITNQQLEALSEENEKDQTIEEELVIPETQEIPIQERNSIVIESSTNQLPFVVIPVTQMFNNSRNSESHHTAGEACDVVNTTNTSLIAVNKKSDHKGQVEESVTNDISIAVEKGNKPTTTTNDVNSVADSLKLTDILTDDEDEPYHNTMSESVLADSQIPLNLAGSNDRTKRLRKRSVSRRRLQKNVHETMSTDPELEPMPLSLNNRGLNRKRSLKKRQIPLNKAPGTPLNGEEFAKELARMSNYEILDLRKRNSMGRVFAMSGRKSEWMKEEVIKKQVQLDDEIEMELLRRNMETAHNDTVVDTETTEVTTTRENTEHEELQNRTDTLNCEELEYPPAPQEFCDSRSMPQPVRSPVRESSLIDEASCDRISFVKRKESHRKSTKTSMPEVLQNYLDATKKISEKKSRKRNSNNTSKRSLYTQGFSESEDMLGNSMTSLPCVPSPPRSETDQMPTLRVVSPPPPLSTSLETLHKTAINKTLDQTAKRSKTPLPPPPPNFETDSGLETNSSGQYQQSVIGKKSSNGVLKKPPPTNFEADSGLETNSSGQCQQSVLGKESTNDVFKKPVDPPPLKKKKLVRQKAVESLESVLLNSKNVTMSSESSADITNGGSLRRSKRGHVPLKHSTTLYQSMLQKCISERVTNLQKKAMQEKKKRGANAKNNKNGQNPNINNSSTPAAKTTKILPVVPETAVLENNRKEKAPSTQSGKKSKRKETKVTRKNKKNEAHECSRISLTTPPPLDHFNNVFDQLRNSIHVDDRPSEENEPIHKPFKAPVKQFRVRVARLKLSDMRKKKAANCKDVTNASHHIPRDVPDNVSVVSSTNDTKQSNIELISWLKNITESDSHARNDAIFKEMRISSASNLSFTELQGVEYAFYDTADQASLGYLRFKPRQIKPRKRAKRYHLHFVTLVGVFRITANDKESLVGPGDMVAIEKSVYYDIENMSDDIGILMVIKK